MSVTRVSWRNAAFAYSVFNFQLRTVDEIDSALVCRMAERVAEGKLSVRGAASCAGDFVADGSVKAGP